MDEINRDMKEAEKALQGMEKCCGLCVLPWKRYNRVRVCDVISGACVVVVVVVVVVCGDHDVTRACVDWQDTEQAIAVDVKVDVQ